METVHRCQACNTLFPDGTSKRRKYCNDACRMRRARTQQRTTKTGPNSTDQLAIQNTALRQQVSRLQAELAKVHDRAMGYRRETHTLRRETDTILDVRRQSLLHFHTQHQQLRATYRQAHLLITRLGQHLAHLSGTTPPVTTAWHVTEHAPGDMLRRPLPSDKDNAATLTHLVADTMTQLDEVIGLSHHQSRTRRNTPPGGMTTGPATPTPDSDVTTPHPEAEQLRSDLDTARAVIAKQREQMLLAKNAHSTLREHYAHQRQLIEQLITDREHTKIIIRQWLILARELYRRTSGRPTEKHHQTIIATWQQYETWAKAGTGS
ncbi:hypothetical protein [Glutamicibacter uratoxydans]|uniref:hypothetical protein n=1 Tax=Glutamicibacter uratoxydans TaxID=43667 RepID=UPI003D701D1C